MSNVRRVVLAGGSGFIGMALAKDFQKAGYEPVILTRSRKRPGEIQTAIWDGKTVGEWAGLLNDAAAVINLSGAPLTKRWTDEVKREIVDSRVDSSQAIGKAIRTCAIPPKVWINASGVGYYGDRGDEELDESSSAGEGFIPEICLAWERAQDEAETPGVRKVKMRTGVVLGREGGAFAELSKLTKRFLGGSQGNGRQWLPWLHLADMCAMYRWAVESEFAGAVNAVGPEPVRNKDFMAALRRAAHRPWSPPAPAFMLSLAGAVMGVQADVMLQSQRAKSRVLQEAGFAYQFPSLDMALADLYKEGEGREGGQEGKERKEG